MLQLIRKTAKKITSNPITLAIFIFSFIILIGVIIASIVGYEREIIDLVMLLGALKYWEIIMVGINEL